MSYTIYKIYFRNKGGHCKTCYKEGALNPIGLAAMTSPTSEPNYRVDLGITTQKGKG